MDYTPQIITLIADDHLRKALEHLARGTDGTLEETAYKAILDAALDTRVADDHFTRNMAAYGA